VYIQKRNKTSVIGQKAKQGRMIGGSQKIGVISAFFSIASGGADDAKINGWKESVRWTESHNFPLAWGRGLHPLFNGSCARERCREKLPPYSKFSLKGAGQLAPTARQSTQSPCMNQVGPFFNDMHALDGADVVDEAKRSV
jgi:hypothetical protein